MERLWRAMLRRAPGHTVTPEIQGALSDRFCWLKRPEAGGGSNQTGHAAVYLHPPFPDHSLLPWFGPLIRWLRWVAVWPGQWHITALPNVLPVCVRTRRKGWAATLHDVLTPSACYA